MRINLDREKCIGSGQCVLAAPDWFDQDDDGIAVVLEGKATEEDSEDLHHAAFTCPALAISLDSE
ncbi:ferredoxin [Streptomyces sp. NRRL S-350]|uniref:ferredoxin n=1 Tax=Streptomyces sp. NRRL S-350 TaxID=1463902 RepID=UPI0004BFF85F|nr:ferredoxin [Streptomyces sp. NRRL S-350]